MDESKEFLLQTVTLLVEKPDEIMITSSSDDMGILLTLNVAAEDMGKVIGRAGNTAKAIRSLLRVIGMKNNARISLKINEPEGDVI